MGDHRGFVIVTAALRDLTQSAVDTVVPGATVRIGLPRPGETVVTLTLYHHTAKAGWLNTDHPLREPRGARMAPLLAFDLHYCISVAGEDQLAGERLLGALTAAIAGQPILTPAMLAAVCDPDGAYPYLAAPEFAAPLLGDPVQLIAQYPSLIDSATLWSSLFALPHRPSLHLIASPVLIEADTPPRVPFPALAFE